MDTGTVLLGRAASARAPTARPAAGLTYDWPHGKRGGERGRNSGGIRGDTGAGGGNDDRE
ncbi:hypothetical protein ACE1SV_41930 [Streptomyces sp. E-15]